jgi:hypothetical protein
MLMPGLLYSFYEEGYYFAIVYEKILGLGYIVMNIFVLPIIYLTVIYARLMYFTRHQTPQGRRAVFVIMTNIDVRFSGAYYMCRIQWIGPVVICIDT